MLLLLRKQSLAARLSVSAPAQARARRRVRGDWVLEQRDSRQFGRKHCRESHETFGIVAAIPVTGVTVATMDRQEKTEDHVASA
jgi:hypothetical protein